MGDELGRIRRLAAAALIYLLVSGIGAYAISYYFSSHTIIYLLLRRSVDGQNLREVFLDEKTSTENGPGCRTNPLMPGLHTVR